jgi:hypothetical protein
MATPRSPVAPVTMMFFPENSMGVLLSRLKWMSHSDAARCGNGDHHEPPKIDVADDEIGRCLQKCLQVLRQRVGVKTFRRTPVLVDEPDIGIIDGPVQIIVEASGL